MTNKEIVIGVSGPFSGKRKVYGELIKTTTAEVTNNMNLINSIKFIYVDDKATVVYAVQAAKIFVDNKVQAVIGHFNSACAKAVAEIYHKNKIIFVAPASSTVNIPFNNKGYVYRTCPNNEEQIRLIVDFFKEQNLKLVKVLSDGTYYAAELESLIKKFLFQDNTLQIYSEKGLDDTKDVGYLAVGTHFFCMNELLRLNRILKKETSIIFCDDCYISEFLEFSSKYVNKHNLYVVGMNHIDGYKYCYETALKSLIKHLLFDLEFRPEKVLWNMYKISSLLP